MLFGRQQTTEFGVTWDTGHLGHGSSPDDRAPEENFRATATPRTRSTTATAT